MFYIIPQLGYCKVVSPQIHLHKHPNMKFGILGTGIVGISIATHLLNHGHEVMIGSRERNNEMAAGVISEFPNHASQGNFAETAAFAPVIFHCVMGLYSLDAARMAGPENFENRTVIDLTNPLDFSQGMPPRLTICNDNSSGEMLQQYLPLAKVVKAFNTVPYGVITNPAMINNKNVDMFICGNDDTAKKEVTELIVQEFGWNRENVIDLGELKHARSTEGLLPFVASYAMRFGSFNNMMKMYKA
jgi:predicted dinucleotide-binding enzyme